MPLKALDEIKAIEELRAAVLQDPGVLRQHEADHHATQQRIALYQDKNGWAQQRVSTGYDDVAGLWEIAQRLNEEKASLSKLGLEIASQHIGWPPMRASHGRSYSHISKRVRARKSGITQ